MKRFIAVAVLFTLVICLLSCSYEGTYDEGYSEGYDDGYSDAKFEMECLIEEEYLGRYDSGYDNGYWDGYLEGSREGWIDRLEDPGRYLEDEAVHYARKYSEWHPEEAMVIIEAYQNNEPLPDENSVPSKQDYLEAIDSLIYFYDYFYSARYE